MNVRVYIDLETGEPHIYRHEVTEEEATYVLENPGKIAPAEKGRGSRSVKRRLDGI